MPTSDQKKHHSVEEGLLRTIRTLGNGSVEVIVQDSRVVQVKVHFSKNPVIKGRETKSRVA
jgi:hypothetical protein